MLIERDIEIATLHGLAHEAFAGRGNVALVLGEAGIGKTTLINSFMADMDKNADIVWGMCDALFTPRPLGPVYDIARMMAGQSAGLAQAREKGDILFPAMFSKLTRVSTPVIMAIEDIHWADHGTLDFVRFMGRRIATLPVLLLVSFRNDEIGVNHPLHQVLGDLPARTTHRLELSPLSLSGIEMLKDGSDFPAKDILTVTGGNPFFVTELLASGDKIADVPSSVREAVNSRLSRVSASERRFLEFVSCIPYGIDTALIETVFEDEAEMLALACIGRGLLKRDGNGALRFRHELARLATAARVSALQNRSIHETVLALLLAQDTPPIDQIVHHASGALDSVVVLKYAPLAAAEAAEVGSHREAAGHLGTALEFVSDAEAELAAHLYESWAYEATLSLGVDEDVIDARRHAITLWRAIGRKDKVGENLRHLSRLHWYRGEAAKAAQLSDEAVRLLENEGPSSEKAMAFSLRSQLHMLNDRMDEAIIWGNKALDNAQGPDSDEVRIHALNNIGTAKLFRGNIDGLPDMQESLRLAKEHRRHEDAARVYTNLSEYAVDFKDFEMAERVISEGIAYDTQHDLDSWTYYLIGRQAQLRLEQGRLKEAEKIARGVIVRPNQSLLMQLPARIVLAKAALRLGHKNASALLLEALQDAASTAETPYIAPVRIAYLELAARLDQKLIAQEHFLKLLELPISGLNKWCWAEFWFWAVRAGLKPPPEYETNLPKPYKLIAKGSMNEAAHAFQAIGMAYMAAWCFYLEGSDASLKTSNKLCADMNDGPLMKLIRKAASSRELNLRSPMSNRGPYSAAKQHPLGLTKREQDVLGALINGASNQDIAVELDRSKRTVENHVSSVLTKFNASNRTDVILRVQNEPWLLATEKD